MAISAMVAPMLIPTAVPVGIALVFGFVVVMGWADLVAGVIVRDVVGVVVKLGADMLVGVALEVCMDLGVDVVNVDGGVEGAGASAEVAVGVVVGVVVVAAVIVVNIDDGEIT